MMMFIPLIHLLNGCHKALVNPLLGFHWGLDSESVSSHGKSTIHLA